MALGDGWRTFDRWRDWGAEAATGRTRRVRIGLELALIRQSEAVRIASDDLGSIDARCL